MCTPIESLHRPMPQIQQQEPVQQQQVMDYSEILRNMHDEPPQQQMPTQQPQIQTQQQQAPGQYFIPPPVVQSMKPQGYVMQPMAPQPTPEPKQSAIGDNQKDIMLVLVLCVIIYSDQFQILLQRGLPSLFRNDKLSAIGTITCALLVAGSFLLSKHVSINF